MDNWTARYSRQIILQGMGFEGQKKLQAAKVLVAGAGGLGSPALTYLAAAGVGTIGIADFDTVDYSNLNRQSLHYTEDIGKLKTASAAEKLLKMNPELTIIQHNLKINSDTVEDLVKGYDVVIDALDNFTARYLISDCCYFLKIPIIEGAAVGYDGILMTIIPDKTPCYRCLYPYPPKDGVVDTCASTGILGAVTGVIGSLQALEAIKVILGLGETVSGRLLTFEALETDFQLLDWTKKKECPLCGEHPTVTDLVEYTIQCKVKLAVDQE